MIDRQTQVAEWMSRNGGTIAECAQSLNITYKSAQHARGRVVKRYGTQAA